MRSNGASPSGGNGSRIRLWRANVTSVAQPLAHDELLAVRRAGSARASRARARAPSASGSCPRARGRGRPAEMSVARMVTGGRAGAERLAGQQREAVGLLPGRAGRGPDPHARGSAGVGAPRAAAASRSLASCPRSRRNEVSLTVTSSISRATQPRSGRADRHARAQERGRVASRLRSGRARAWRKGCWAAANRMPLSRWTRSATSVERARHDDEPPRGAAPAGARPISAGPRMSSAPRSAAALGMP